MTDGQDIHEPHLEMSFMPNTIEHLGARLYSTLPPVIAELIANSYDADASEVRVELHDADSAKEIVVRDNGHGMSFNEINTNFLRIGRNRRDDTQSDKSPNGRAVIGKKGLGKLSFFGIAHTITVSTVKDGLRNTFNLEWSGIVGGSNNKLKNYRPGILEYDAPTQDPDGTVIKLGDIQRISDFDAGALADSLSRIFIIDSEFDIYVKRNSEEAIQLTNERRYSTLNTDIEWSVPVDINVNSDYDKATGITGHLIATKTPISPSTNMRGITLYSRKKLVNLPEYFSDSTSSHFFSYLTGWLEVDFIDELDEDVIETNRQSLNWEHPGMAKLRVHLQKMIKWLERDWRAKRTARQERKITESTGINISEWKGTMPSAIQTQLEPLINALRKDSELPEREEDSVKGFENLHKLIPPYPYYQWRHMHLTLQTTTFEYYKNGDYYHAVEEGVKKYISEVKVKSGSTLTDLTLLQNVFAANSPKLIVTEGFVKSNGDPFTDLTQGNIKNGHKLLAEAMWQAFRSPIAHEEVTELRISGLYTEQDCLDALSLLSHLYSRLDRSTPNNSN